MMGGMNLRQRTFAYNFCVKRNGEKCNVTGCIRTKLIVDHIDNNDKNNPKDGSNWQLLCRHHNYIKNPRRCWAMKYFTARMQKVESSEPGSPELRKSELAFPLYCEWLRRKVNENTAIPMDQAINSGAMFVTKCGIQLSPATIRSRYLPMLISSDGDFDADDTSPTNVLIRFKPKHLIGIIPTDNGINDLISKEDGDV
jgi:hypothetical protein